VLRVHLIPALGDKPLASITTEDVQQFKSALSARSPKTVNNILTVLNVLMRIAVEWHVIERVPCVIKMLKAPKSQAAFYDFDQFERLVERARMDQQAHLVVLLGGEAGLRCGEMIGLEWLDIDLETRQLCVARSEWRGHVGAPKGGRIRYVPMTKRLVLALNGARHLRGPRVLCDSEGKPLTQKMVQVMMRRAASRANVKAAWDEWVQKGYVSAPKEQETKAKSASSAIADVRESVAPDQHTVPVTLRDPYHQPHLQNFFDAVRGKATLNCPAEEAYQTAVAVLKVNEAIEAKTRLAFNPEDFKP
jgi:integrase